MADISPNNSPLVHAPTPTRPNILRKTMCTFLEPVTEGRRPKVSKSPRPRTPAPSILPKNDDDEGRKISFIKRINSLKKKLSVTLEDGIAGLDIEAARKWERRCDGDGVESEDED